MYTQGINQSANLSFVQRLSVIFGFRRDSAISSFLPRLLCLVNSFPLTLSVGFSFLSRVSAGNRITWTVSAGSHFSWRVVSAGSRRSWTVSAEAKYDSLCRKQKSVDSFIPCGIQCAVLLGNLKYLFSCKAP